MSIFKDILKQDEATFFNEDEFSETHNIDDKDVVITIDNDLLKERQAKHAEGTYLGSLLFFIKKVDFGYEPAINQHVKFDGDTKFVTDFQDDMEVYIITLGENKS
ncbi:hypothetical protein [Clostridium sp.]|uniref:hypothetical protein n=1 Tax=Clostridium sp. TaxID=1506 RepID=UPI002605CC16|nr:hypothetical protein [Clostridium sp.]